MNFFDSYDIARAPTPQPPDANQPTLNEEVNQLVGQIGRFWGGFKRQSQQAFEVAKKDLGDVVVQAQKEIEKLTVTVEEPQPEASTSTAGEAAGQTTRSAPSGAAPTPEGTATPTPESAQAASSAAQDQAEGEGSASSSNAGLFSRLQSALPPNLLATVQSHIPESIKHASETIDIQQLGTNLRTEFQRVQGITRAQAEEYARKSEALIREAVKEANEVLKDAVKIIPPDPAEAGAAGAGAGGMIWDGSDMWMLPNAAVPTGSGKERAGGEGESSQNAVASRAIALLQRLRSDPSIIQVDPAAERGVKEVYGKWVEEEVKAKGGFENAEWAEKIGKLLKEETSLYEMYTSLVPATLSKDEFWSRYFFRAHQIKVEEERRKALIQAHTAESDEDFSWEDDDDDHPTTSASTPGASTAAAAAAVGGVAVAAGAAATVAAAASSEKSAEATKSSALPVQTSPVTSVGSAESFDVLSSTNASVAGDTTATKKAAPGTAASSDDDEEEDSDEEEEEEEDDDDGEEESESDWE